MKADITLNLPVSILREDKQYVAYTPALDLSTSGETFEEAQKNFTEAVLLFFEELQAMGTTDQVLSGLEWKKRDKLFTPPVIVSQQTESFSIPLTN